MPKLKLGAACYAVIAVFLAVSVVGVLRGWGSYADVHGWPIVATAVLDALAAVLFAIGAVTRRGRRMQESYCDGVAEAEVEIRAARGEELPPGR
ncbi:hypothetical protein [Kribbella swartbergensis]